MLTWLHPLLNRSFQRQTAKELFYDQGRFFLIEAYSYTCHIICTCDTICCVGLRESDLTMESTNTYYQITMESTNTYYHMTQWEGIGFKIMGFSAYALDFFHCRKCIGYTLILIKLMYFLSFLNCFYYAFAWN